MKFKLAHLIKIPKPYVPEVATDISKTIAAEKRRLKEVAACVPLKSTRVTPLRRKEK